MENITLPLYLLSSLLADAGEVAVQKFCESTGQGSVGVSKQAAYRKYGRAKIDQWIADGQLKKNANGKWCIPLSKLASLHKIEQKPAYRSIKQHR
ncbi:hypothetical protein [Pedobacter duraquae]|uniref:Uncharacterized protein n=1 Tax=Pedobacter duraquae TaxID=425511 RepID=A0A4R6IIX8_9SPHI|nr:hypothetical protein [Pedobacter duraquae]TDO21931.1 hypothetical protein CLV32_3039 [Pedobacter duraquae]